MDDEEEDMSRPISQLWGTSFREVKYEERAAQIAAGQAIDALPCSFHRQPRVPFHGEDGPPSLQTTGRGEENDRMAAERPEEQAGLSVEAQIGRKLREIGDKFHQDHVELQRVCVWVDWAGCLYARLKIEPDSHAYRRSQ
uniref:Uncharacterized protein n=1 Tax=Salarias fasciatus TaxID=181472 RepID=A0A672GN88_SALFA